MSQPDPDASDGDVFWCPYCQSAFRTHRDAFDHAAEHVPAEGDSAATVMFDFSERPVSEIDGDDYQSAPVDAENDAADDTTEKSRSAADESDDTPRVGAGETGVQIRVSGTHIPADLKERDVWVMWAAEHGKVPMAPWQTGHCYPAAWGAGVDEHPATDFESVQVFTDLSPAEIQRNYSFPPGEDGDDPLVPDEVKPTFYLPHDPPDPPIMLVDFDDVVIDGTIPREVFDIIQRLDAYTEVSSSGEGLHCFVRGRLPDGLGKYIADLDSVGHIEMYDHGRMVGATWEHVAGTPTDVPERQRVVNDLIGRYETVQLTMRRLRNRNDADDALTELSDLRDTDGNGISETTRTDEIVDELSADIPSPGTPDAGASSASDDATSAPSVASGASSSTGASGADIGTRIGRSTGEGKNAYFQLDIRDVADTGPFSAHRRDARNPAPSDWEGPHPAHGGTSTPDAESTNFGAVPNDDVWHCFAHDTGGGPLALLAVIEGIVPCQSARRVYDDGDTQLRACLAARERSPALEDEKPPAKVLEAVAEHFDIGDPDDMVSDDYRVARKIYDELDRSDL